MMFEKIEKGIWKGSVGQPEAHTPVALRPFPAQSGSLERMEEAELPAAAGQIAVRKNRRGIQLILPMDSSEDIYGFGLQLRSMNQAGRKRIIRVNSDPVADTGEGHAPVPFYISTAGYGLFVDTFRHVEFYMGTSLEKGRSAGKKEVNLDHKEFSESALYALKRSEERRCIIIDVKAVDGVDFYLFSGNVKQVVQRYNLFSGGGCLPPMWGLGIWYWWTYSQVRSSGALAGPLPFVLYSDLYDHKQFIRGMVTSGFCGLLWAPEVRSCKNGEDLLRRMETICFSVHAIYNCWRIPNSPWKQVDIEKNLAGQFMEDSDYYTDVCRRYHEVRMSLVPYLYSAFVKYQREGLPPVRRWYLITRTI